MGLDPKEIVILTGAGVSAESGLGTFRDASGLWTKYDLSEVATPEGYAADPAKVHDFYNARRANAAAAEPNAAHFALAKLSGATLVTQNVDGLQEAAGSKNVIHMHGALDRMRCTNCTFKGPAMAEIHPSSTCSDCGAKALRPDIVWFGEIPMHMELITQKLLEAKLFVAIGTSGTVYPAAGFVERARANGAHTLEINLEPSEVQSAFHEKRYGPAGELVPAWVDEMLG